MKHDGMDAIFEQRTFRGEFGAASWVCSDEQTGSYDGFMSIDIQWNGSLHDLWSIVCLFKCVVVLVIRRMSI